MQAIYEKQVQFQVEVTGEENLPLDSPQWLQYHMTGMLEELGEVLKADKRWKTHRNVTYNKDEKIDEIADVFIEAMNIAIFSGLTAEQLMQSVSDKINQNTKKLYDEKMKVRLEYENNRNKFGE